MQNLELEKQKAEETSEELWRKLQAQEEEKMGLRDQMDKLKKMILNENNDETHIKKVCSTPVKSPPRVTHKT